MLKEMYHRLLRTQSEWSHLTLSGYPQARRHQLNVPIAKGRFSANQLYVALGDS